MDACKCFRLYNVYYFLLFLTKHFQSDCLPIVLQFKSVASFKNILKRIDLLAYLKYVKQLLHVL